MSKYKLTILTPIHISSGDEYELNYNLLEKDGFVYLYDEFKIAEFFIANDIEVPSNINELKRVIQQKSDEIISSNLHLRKIESNFSRITKPLLSQITTADNPIITGSSIKGSLRTAILDNLYNRYEDSALIKKLIKKRLTTDRLSNNKGKVPYDNEFANIFKYLKVTDSLLPLETQVYKTINMKKDKNHQGSREKKVEEIANYVEAIKPNQSFEIEIKDIHEKQIFQNLSMICNKFYIPFFANDAKQYFSKNTDALNKAKNANKGMFIINVGRFSGAERKSLNNIRYIKASKADDKSVTSARTFALEESTDDKIYFENSLIPFGWVMCEKLDSENMVFKTSELEKKIKYREKRSNKFLALDALNEQKQKKIEEKKKIILAKQKLQEEKEKKDQEKKAKREAEFAAMSPIEKIIDSYDTLALAINAMRDGSIENFEEIKIELAQKIKDELQENPKEWERAKQKALKRKKYIEGILNNGK